MKKRTIGLITIHKGINFGTALQTFATYTILKRLGFSCVLIDYKYPAKYHLTQAVRDENKRREKIPFPFQFLTPFLSFVKHLLNGTFLPMHRQKKLFSEFMKRIPQTKSYDMISIVKQPPHFDIFLTGSDQCWNPRYMHHDLSMLLNFVPDSIPKISYSSSFGCSELPQEFREEYRQLLLRYHALSVREKSGCPLIEKLTGRHDTKYVLDPTFLLTKDEWLGIVSSHAKKRNKAFILCYILDYVFQAYPMINTIISEIKKTIGLPVVFIGQNQYPCEAEDETLLDVGPEDFLTLMSDATFVVTTSFHGTAFSINFRKNFLSVLNPNISLDDRVSNLLKTMELQSRGIILGQSPAKALKEKTLYSDRNETIISELRKESISYLSQALETCIRKK